MATIFVEPIFRASRLHILANCILNIDENEKIFIISRNDAKMEQLYEINILLVHRDITLINANMHIQEWIRNLNIKEFSEIIYQLKMLGVGKSDTVYFMALDEYLVPFSLFSPLIGLILNSQVFVLKYRVADLLNKRFYRLILGIALVLSKSRMIAFDERFENDRLIYKVLPDTWIGGFNDQDISYRQNRRNLGLPQDSFIFLCIGKQDERKGIGFVLKNMDKIRSIDNASLLIAGEVNRKFEEILRIEIEKGGIIYRPSYIDESDLPYIFRAADCVLLPYSITFNASSGVLPRAAASGKPVIATSHGLVGYRVENYKLGLVFEYNNSEEFLEKLKEIRGSADAYSNHLESFAQKTHASELRL